MHLRKRDKAPITTSKLIYFGFVALVSFQVLQILYVQLAAIGSNIFRGKLETTMPYHQYVVVEPAGVIAYSKPSLTSGSIVSSFAHGTILQGTGEVVRSTDVKQPFSETFFIVLNKDNSFVPISTMAPYRIWPNTIKTKLKQYLELVSPIGKVVNGICRYATECEPDDKIAKQWGKSVTTRYSQSYCCKVHVPQRYAILEIMKALERNKVIAFLESGTILGVRRHSGKQVPWTFDADIGFVVDGDVLKMHTFEKFIHRMVERELPGWTVKTVHKLDQNGNGACGQIQLSDVNNNRFDLLGYRHNHYSDQDREKYGTDFGYLGTCFEYARKGGKYIMPPRDCQFYDVTVKCPRDVDGYLAAVYGKDVLGKGVDHGWDPNNIYGFNGDETFKFHLDNIVFAKVPAWSKFYKGKIVKVKKGKMYDIKFEDGELKLNVKEQYVQSEIPAPKFRVDHVVMAKVPAWPKFFRGRIVHIRDGPLYDIQFDDGEFKKSVEEKYIKTEEKQEVF